MSVDQQKISAVILAGGRGQRMGGEDKGLVQLDGRPLVAWMIDRIGPQVDELLISANRHLDQYGRFGYPVLADTADDFRGPLAGLSRGMATAAHSLVLSAPCDTPFLPPSLVKRLVSALISSNSDLALPVTGGQTHRAVCLYRKKLLPSLDDFLAKGGRRVGEWQSLQQGIEVPFEDADEFVNLNTAGELELAQHRLRSFPRDAQ